MGHRAFKQRIYPEFARIAQALASDRRLELIDLLAQAPRHVEALAEESEMSVANVSQHLQVLRAARLVETERDGTRVVYRLAGDDVLRLWLDLREVAERRLAEIPAARREFGTGDNAPAVDRAMLLAQMERDDALVIDVRPRLEYDHGHLPGALSYPPDELARRLDELPRERTIVAYCRGPFCLNADEAVALLRERGYTAHRLDGGLPDWEAEGRLVERGVPPTGDAGRGMTHARDGRPSSTP